MSKQTVKATVYDKKGRVLAIGYNSYTKTHPTQARFARLAGAGWKTYLHAEIAALVKIRGSTPFAIRVERYGADGSPRLSRPCPVCWLAIEEAGIKEVSYTVGQ